VIDLHSHVLPGIDDGPENAEESVVLARAAAAAGTRILVATPHVSARYPNNPERIARLVHDLSRRLAAEGLALEVRGGAEVALTRAVSAELEDLRRMTLGGGPWLLVEPPFSPAAKGIDELLHRLLGRGLRIVLAHPERCPAFQRDPQMLRALVGDGVLVSITAASLVGRFSTQVSRFAMTLLREGLVHNVASDTHDLYARPPSIGAELDQAGLGALADWLTRAVPAAILDGGEIPPRPAVALPELKRERRRGWGKGRLTRTT
jgi:protein-tyrosine phosphatase